MPGKDILAAFLTAWGCLFIATLSACGIDAQQAVGLRCSPSRECPASLLCVQGRCQLTASSDAGSVDADFTDAAKGDVSVVDAGPGDVRSVDAEVDAGPFRIGVEVSPPVSSVVQGRTALFSAIELRSNGAQVMLRENVTWTLVPATAGVITAQANGSVAVRALQIGTMLVQVNSEGDTGQAQLRVEDAVVESVSAHQTSSAVLLSNGEVYGFGINTRGQIDGPPYDTRLLPEALNITDVVKVAAGGEMTFALRDDGTVWSQGSNTVGQLGHGGTDADPVDRAAAVVDETGSAPLTDVVDVVAGYAFGAAPLDDGRVLVWGYNNFGQLAQADLLSRATPVVVAGLPEIESIAAGAAHMLAVDENGCVWAWGRNEFGQLGDGTTGMEDAVPHRVVGVGGVGFLEDIDGVAAGQNHSLAFENRQATYSWGRNTGGQLGHYDTMDRAVPRHVGSPGDPNPQRSITNTDAIWAGYNSSYIWTTTDNFYAFGDNVRRQLGLSDDTNRVGPTPVAIGGSAVNDLEDFAAGGWHAVLLRDDGSLWSWGGGNEGQLGTGSMLESADPAVVAIP